jgi:hypothetical protein
MTPHIISYLTWALVSLTCNLLNARAIFSARRQSGNGWIKYIAATLPFIAVCSSITISVEPRYFVLINLLIQIEATLFFIIFLSTAIRDRRRAKQHPGNVIITEG